MSLVRVELELDQSSKSYGFVHVAGCRDLRDPLPLGAVSSFADIGVIVGENTGWDCDDEYTSISPCARKALAQ
jgi:hypothetical protein